MTGAGEGRGPVSPVPPGSPSTGAKVGAWLGIVVGTLYVMNPTGGCIEVLPDTLPFVGNLDEAAFTGLVLWGLRRLGVDPLRAGQREPGP